MFIIMLSLAFLFAGDTFSQDYPLAEETKIFSGRVAKINRVARLARIKIKFENAKFLAKNNQIEIWNDSVPNKKCFSYLEGKSSDYILVRIPKFNRCMKTIYFSVGSYIHMQSTDLNRNLNTAKELVNILQRKRTALNARLERHKKSIDSYIEKTDVVNKRYEILKQKLELEWQRELSALEEDKTQSYLNFQKTQARLYELDYKLQQYRVRDQNMIEDRWSLDPKLYYKK